MEDVELEDWVKLELLVELELVLVPVWPWIGLFFKALGCTLSVRLGASLGDMGP